MGEPVFHGPRRGDERMRRDQAPKDAGPPILRAESAKKIEVQPLQIEPFAQVFEAHARLLARDFNRLWPPCAVWGDWTPTFFSM